jgi:hypothetical protein
MLIVSDVAEVFSATIFIMTALKADVSISSKSPENNYRSTWRHIPKYSNFKDEINFIIRRFS